MTKTPPLSLSAFFVLLLSCLTGGAQEIPENRPAPKHQAFRAVPFTEVRFDDAFWSPRLAVNRDISIPHNFEWCEKTGRFNNFAKAARLLPGNFEGIYFNDSDVYKLLEGVAYSLADHPDPALEKQADAVIDRIAAAQLPNGYLNTYFQLREPDKKWTNIVMHELYCAGHLIEAAVAYKRATGKDTLLNVTEKFVDHIIDVFGADKKAKFEVPGHEEIELALVKLYELTGKEKYLTLSEQFIDVRGDQSKRGDKIHGAYDQDHEPIRDASEIAGHAVRAVYLYAGVADIAAYTGDEGYIKAMDRLWSDVTNKKMYVTGGIGARHEGEAFGDAFELPNRTAYCETCAAIGLVFWAQRMNLLHGDAKYADVVERAMYNGVLSGIGMDGKHFFYVNPLESAGNHHRQPFFDCACCPTNVVRFVPSLPGYQYATSGNTIYINQFASGKATLQLPDGEVTVTQKTNYPWDGIVHFSFDRKPNPDVKGTFDVKIRQPQWLGTREGNYSVTYSINWDKPAGDEEFSNRFPMQVKRLVANPKVEADRGRVAIQRGPLVYCFEQVDNEVPVRQIVLAKDPEFREVIISEPGVLAPSEPGVSAPGGANRESDNSGGYAALHPRLDHVRVVLKCKDYKGRELTAIPYYAWDHREPGAMIVWVRQQGLSRNPEVDDPAWVNDKTNEPILYRELTDAMLNADETFEELEFEAVVQASHCHNNDGLEAVNDGREPKNSNDHSIPRMTFWDHKGTAEWIEIDFGKTHKISKSSVYWFDDTGRGECRVPESWRLSYRDGKEWKPVKTMQPFSVDKDRYNTVEFDAVETPGLRIDLKLQSGVSGGILEWKTE